MIRPIAEPRKTPVGCLAFVFLFLLPLALLAYVGYCAYVDYRIFARYVPGQCVVTDKTLVTVESDDSVSYKPVIDFQINVDGRIYRPAGYDTWGRTYNYGAGDRIVRQFSVGQSYPCWYDPENPTNAVLVQHASRSYWLLLLALALAAGGVAYLVSGVRKRLHPVSPEAELLAKEGKPGPITVQFGKPRSIREIAAPPPTRGTVLPVRLSTAKIQPGWGCLLFSLALMTLWYPGIVYFWSFPPLAIGGVAGTIGLVISVMGLMNRTRIGDTIVEVTSDKLLPGQSFEVWLSQSGNVQINSVCLRLVCEERATYAQGSSTTTDTTRVYDQALLEQKDLLLEWARPFESRVRAAILPDAMHSFKSEHNQIAWFLEVYCDIPRWPDTRSKFELTILPQGGTEAQL